MSAMAFDTYTAAKRLRDAGFNEHQAEAAVTMVRDAVVVDQEARATKADVDAAISGFESRLTARMDVLEARMDTLEVRMDTRMDALEARMDNRMDALEARMDALEARMGTRMDALEARMDTFATKAELAALETRLTHRLYAVVLAAVAANGIIAAALKAL